MSTHRMIRCPTPDRGDVETGWQTTPLPQITPYSPLSVLGLNGLCHQEPPTQQHPDSAAKLSAAPAALGRGLGATPLQPGSFMGAPGRGAGEGIWPLSPFLGASGSRCV